MKGSTDTPQEALVGIPSTSEPPWLQHGEYVRLKDGSILDGLAINGTYLESSPVEEKNIADLTVKTTETGKNMKASGEFRIQ